METQNRARTAHRRRVKSWLDEIRSVPCKDCGNKFPPECMDFDHLPGTVKMFGIMNQYGSKSRKDIITEISKCEVVCANCHRIRTASRR